MDKLEFERYWTENREKILNANSEYRKVRDSYKSLSAPTICFMPYRSLQA